MLYQDIMHPVNVARFMYDILCVAVRSFSPETLVRRRRLRRSETSTNAPRRTSRPPSANTSLNASAVGSALPPLPNRHPRPPTAAASTPHTPNASSWLATDVSREVQLFVHVMRAAPVAVLHFFCQLKTDAATLPLMRFADLNRPATAQLPRDEDALLAADYFPDFLITRVWLLGLQQYVLERMLPESTLVVRGLRSRRALRNATAWAVSLALHTPLDPFAWSVFTPILFARGVRPLRGTPAGLFASLACGFAGVVLEMLIVPRASRMCQQMVVRIADGAEYLLFRRYTRDAAEVENDTQRGNGGNGGSESEREENTSAYASQNDTETDDVDDVAKKERDEKDRHRRRSRMERMRREEKERSNEAAIRQSIFRAIGYRVVAALVAQCLVQHPLSVLSRMLYSRAVLHAVGLTKAYDEMDNTTATLHWRAIWQFVRQSGDCTAQGSSGVPALEVLRRLGHFAGHEAVMIGETIRQHSGQDAAIRELRTRLEQRRDGRASAEESAELMRRSIVSLSPLFAAVAFTAVDKLLNFYLAVGSRLRGE